MPLFIVCIITIITIITTYHHHPTTITMIITIVVINQVLADAGRDSAEASIMAEEAGAWASTVADLADGEGLAAKGRTLKDRIEELKNR